jgi:hypothetical protein
MLRRMLLGEEPHEGERISGARIGHELVRRRTAMAGNCPQIGERHEPCAEATRELNCVVNSLPTTILEGMEPAAR